MPRTDEKCNVPHEIWIVIYFKNFIAGTSSNTDVDWASFCREVCEETLMRRSEKMGGGETWWSRSMKANSQKENMLVIV